VSETAGAPEVLLYRRDGCHLCEDAETNLCALALHLPFRLVLVDIAADPELEERYLFDIPVVEVGGEQVCKLTVDIEAVRVAVLAQQRPG
jgi:hypothetical protein